MRILKYSLASLAGMSGLTFWHQLLDNKDIRNAIVALFLIIIFNFFYWIIEFNE